MANHKKGDKVRLSTTYRARGFRLEPSEQVAADFSDFDPSAHDPLLIEVSNGDALIALSDSENGKVLVEASHENQLYACILLADIFESA